MGSAMLVVQTRVRYAGEIQARGCGRRERATAGCIPLWQRRRGENGGGNEAGSFLLRCRRASTLVRAGKDGQDSRDGQDDGSVVANTLDSSFGVFKFGEYARPLAAPWSLKSSVFGMVGWAASFLLVGLAFLPIAKVVAGDGGFAALSQQDKAVRNHHCGWCGGVREATNSSRLVSSRLDSPFLQLARVESMF